VQGTVLAVVEREPEYGSVSVKSIKFDAVAELKLGEPEEPIVSITARLQYAYPCTDAIILSAILNVKITDDFRLPEIPATMEIQCPGKFLLPHVPSVKITLGPGGIDLPDLPDWVPKDSLCPGGLNESCGIRDILGNIEWFELPPLPDIAPPYNLLPDCLGNPTIGRDIGESQATEESCLRELPNFPEFSVGDMKWPENFTFPPGMGRHGVIQGGGAVRWLRPRRPGGATLSRQ
jgi:hypothetical protein